MNGTHCLLRHVASRNLVCTRDHTNKIFYYQTANSYVWRSIDLANMDWSKLGGKVAATPLQPPKQSGVLDVTHTWLSGST
jgi:hypothetical protein